MYSYINNYPLFVNQLTTFAYLPTSLLYVIPMSMYRPDVITPEARAIPQKVWFIMGFLDSLAGVMQSLAVDKILSGSLTVLLLQSAIPVSMLISKLFLRTSYRASQYVGALVVLVGLAAALGPTLAQGTGGEGAADTAIWSSVLILSCVPMCLSSVYKEKALGDTEIDAIYLNFWVAVWQFVLGFPLLLPMAPASNLPISQIGSNLLNGARCYAGFNSMDGDNCGLAPLFVTVYILFNLAYNILIILSEFSPDSFASERALRTLAPGGASPFVVAWDTPPRRRGLRAVPGRAPERGASRAAHLRAPHHHATLARCAPHLLPCIALALLTCAQCSSTAPATSSGCASRCKSPSPTLCLRCRGCRSRSPRRCGTCWGWCSSWRGSSRIGSFRWCRSGS